MALTTTVTDLVFVLQNVNFDAAMVINDLSGHLDLGKCRRVAGDLSVFNEEQRSEFIS